MKLAHVLVCHSVDPTRAIESIPPKPDSPWYVFLHSDLRAIEQAVAPLINERGGTLFPYRQNLGLARSWNEALHLAMSTGCKAMLILNDDLFFYEDGYAAFRQTIEAAVHASSGDLAFVTVNGLETGPSPHSGQILAQSFACCAITADVVRRIGYFDENFTPAYYEDLDYARRAELAGMRMHVDERLLVEHKRSSTLRLTSELQARGIQEEIKANQAYFVRKWGEGQLYTHPFNRFDLDIPFDRRGCPYGECFDRTPDKRSLAVRPV